MPTRPNIRGKLRVTIVDPGATRDPDAALAFPGEDPDKRSSRPRTSPVAILEARSSSDASDRRDGPRRACAEPGQPCRAFRQSSASSSPSSPARRRCRRRGNRLRNTSGSSATVVERLVEAVERAALRPPRRSAARQRLQRLGIIAGRSPRGLPREAALARERCEPRLVDQHPAGEDVGLDEVGIARVAVEQLVIGSQMNWSAARPPGFRFRAMRRDRRPTSAGRPPRPSRPRRRRRTARRRRDSPARRISIAVGQAGLGDLAPRPRPSARSTGSGRRPSRRASRAAIAERAPAAADLEQALAGLQVEPVEQQRAILRSCASSSARRRRAKPRVE